MGQDWESPPTSELNVPVQTLFSLRNCPNFAMILSGTETQSCERLKSLQGSPRIL